MCVRHCVACLVSAYYFGSAHHNSSGRGGADKWWPVSVRFCVLCLYVLTAHSQYSPQHPPHHLPSSAYDVHYSVAYVCMCVCTIYVSAMH